MDQTNKSNTKRTKHHRKRQLDKGNDANNAPHRKKMRLHQMMNRLHTSNQTLKQENYKIKQQNNVLTKQIKKKSENYKQEINSYKKKEEHYKDGITIYKKEAEKWKTEYTKLYNTLQSITNNNTNINPNTSEKQIDNINNDNDNDLVIGSMINHNMQSTTTNETNTNNNNDSATQSDIDIDIPMNMSNMPNIPLNLQLPKINNYTTDIPIWSFNCNDNDSNASPIPKPRQFSKPRTSVSSVHNTNNHQDIAMVDTNDNTNNEMDEDDNSDSQSYVTDKESHTSDSMHSNTENNSDSEDKPTINKVKKKRRKVKGKKKKKMKGKNLDGTQRYSGRLLLNDAMKNAETMEGWSAPRKKAFKLKNKNPNSYYYRFLDPGYEQKNGPFTAEEHKLFMQRILEIGVNEKWGTFSEYIPRRVGYQCSAHWNKLRKRGHVSDNFYYYDKKTKTYTGSMKKNTKNFKLSLEYKKYAFVVHKDSSGVWTNLPKKHPKHPSDKYCQQVTKALGQQGNGTIDSNESKYNSVRDKLLEMELIDKTEIENRIATYKDSGKSASVVFSELFQVYCPGNDATIGSRRTRSKKKRKTRKKKPKYKAESEIDWKIKTDKPYKCNVKMNGVRCTSSTGYKQTMKEHWKRHFKMNKNNNNSNNNNNESDCSASDNESVSCNDNFNDEFEKQSDFEQSYYFSVNCHICKTHFNEYFKYRNHLKDHYVNDENKIWRQCDFGCRKKLDKPLYCDVTTFIAHLTMHTNKNPWHCNIIIDGKKCSRNYNQKSKLKKHWSNDHRNKNHNENIDNSTTDSDESSSDSET